MKQEAGRHKEQIGNATVVVDDYSFGIWIQQSTAAPPPAAGGSDVDSVVAVGGNIPQ